MSKTALIVIDMINTYDHQDAERLLPSAREVVPVLSDLLKTARSRDVTGVARVAASRLAAVS